VDPIYPLVHCGAFYAEYDAFWQLSNVQQAEVESSFLALIMITLAMGTQFLCLPGDTDAFQENRKSGAEFYASACHQALRLGAYLNRTSVQTLQAMVLLTYFLMNANHATAGWAFSGIIIRQAYALGLNRDPSLLMDPSATRYQIAERRRLWQAIVCQDAFMSVILRLPPMATHADIDHAAPLIDGGPSMETPPSTDSSPQEGMNTSPEGVENSFDSVSDIGYVNALYSLALLVQETISSPRSLSLPLAATPKLRTQLLSRFRTCYRSFPDTFRAWTDQSICELYQQDVAGKRLVRQIFFVTSNYYHCIMLIHQEGVDSLAESQISRNDMMTNNSDQGEPYASLKGTLEAAHEALRVFFVCRDVLKGEANTWWVMCHRAFIEAVRTSILIPFSRAHGSLLLTSPSAHHCRLAQEVSYRGGLHRYRYVDCILFERKK
jgi:Fungal specific transcription factor domain